MFFQHPPVAVEQSRSAAEVWNGEGDLGKPILVRLGNISKERWVP